MRKMVQLLSQRLLSAIAAFDALPEPSQSSASQRYRRGGWALGGLALVVIGILTVIVLHSHSPGSLSPAGTIASQQRQLIYTASLLMALIVVPVIGLTFWFAFRYRRGQGATYQPDWDHNAIYETIWWTVPLLLILVLSSMAARSSHQLDPFKPLASSQTPVRVQVVALPWKWLFIYPDQGVATVNYVRFPANTPVDFEITADAPMNSFWIPQLGGQVYAMSGMSTQLHLAADRVGSYRGSSANLSGKGFAAMNFTAEAMDTSDFNSWLERTKAAGRPFDMTDYAVLAQPSEHQKPASYASADRQLYDKVLMKYMAPASPNDDTTSDSMNMPTMTGMTH